MKDIWFVMCHLKHKWHKWHTYFSQCHLSAPTVFVLPDLKPKSKCDCSGSKWSRSIAQDTCSQFAGYKQTPVSRILPILM